MENSPDPSWMLMVVTFGVPMAVTVTVIVSMITIRCRAVLIMRVVGCHGRDCSVNCW
jgi:hypothetical protein